MKEFSCIKRSRQQKKKTILILFCSPDLWLMGCSSMDDGSGDAEYEAQVITFEAFRKKGDGCFSDGDLLSELASFLNTIWTPAKENRDDGRIFKMRGPYSVK